jgi:hypothetical protein
MCFSWNDCSDSLVCTDGICSSNGIGALCETWDDCSGRLTCTAGKCATPSYYGIPPDQQYGESDEKEDEGNDDQEGEGNDEQKDEGNETFQKGDPEFPTDAPDLATTYTEDTLPDGTVEKTFTWPQEGNFGDRKQVTRVKPDGSEERFAVALVGEEDEGDAALVGDEDWDDYENEDGWKDKADSFDQQAWDEEEDW